MNLYGFWCCLNFSLNSSALVSVLPGGLLVGVTGRLLFLSSRAVRAPALPISPGGAVTTAGVAGVGAVGAVAAAGVAGR